MPRSHSRSRRNRSRRNRSRSNRSRRNRHQRGGNSPVDWADSGGGPSTLNLEQGKQFAEFHKSQHGGNAPYPGGVTGSMLDASLVPSARVGTTLSALQSVQGLRDPSPSNPAGQAGGRRRRNRQSRRKNRKSRRNNRSQRKNRSRKHRRSRRNTRSRRQRGGAGLVRWGGARGGAYQGSLNGATPVGESTSMLISPEQQLGAGLNPEWKLAENPMAFAPRN